MSEATLTNQLRRIILMQYCSLYCEANLKEKNSYVKLFPLTTFTNASECTDSEQKWSAFTILQQELVYIVFVDDLRENGCIVQ